MAATVSTPVSPKVASGAKWAVLATLALTVLTAITPDMLAFLGPYAQLAYGLVVALASGLAAYMKRDPLRDAGAAVTDAKALPAGINTPLPTASDTPLVVASDTPLPTASDTPLVVVDDPAPTDGGAKHRAE
jgi:hypothetical protein